MQRLALVFKERKPCAERVRGKFQRGPPLGGGKERVFDLRLPRRVFRQRAVGFGEPVRRAVIREIGGQDEAQLLERLLHLGHILIEAEGREVGLRFVGREHLDIHAFELRIARRDMGEERFPVSRGPDGPQKVAHPPGGTGAHGEIGVDPRQERFAPRLQPDIFGRQIRRFVLQRQNLFRKRNGFVHTAGLFVELGVRKPDAGLQHGCERLFDGSDPIEHGERVLHGRKIGLRFGFARPGRRGRGFALVTDLHHAALLQIGKDLLFL